MIQREIVIGASGRREIHVHANCLKQLTAMDLLTLFSEVGLKPGEVFKLITYLWNRDLKSRRNPHSRSLFQLELNGSSIRVIQ